MPATTKEKINKKLQRAMTVEQLIENLKHENPKAKVVFLSDYGDYVHTQQLTSVANIDAYFPEEEEIYETAYSKSGLAVRERGEFKVWEAEKNALSMVEADVVILR